MENKSEPKRQRVGKRAFSLVVHCRRLDGSLADVWVGRRTVYLHLSCGHICRRVSLRRFLIGERVPCPVCEKGFIKQAPLPGFDLELT